MCSNYKSCLPFPLKSVLWNPEWQWHLAGKWSGFGFFVNLFNCQSVPMNLKRKQWHSARGKKLKIHEIKSAAKITESFLTVCYRRVRWCFPRSPLATPTFLLPPLRLWVTIHRCCCWSFTHSLSFPSTSWIAGWGFWWGGCLLQWAAGSGH